jgi:hypothetical protein
LGPFKERAENYTGMAEKSSWDQANRRQKHGLVWRDRKKISQIIKDYSTFTYRSSLNYFMMNKYYAQI